VVVNVDVPDWMPLLRRAFKLARDAGDPGDDQALANLRKEAERVLPLLDRSQRIFVVAERP